MVGNVLIKHNYNKSFERASLRPDLCRAMLSVLAPRHLALLAGAQLSRVQTIPFNNERL